MAGPSRAASMQRSVRSFLPSPVSNRFIYTRRLRSQLLCCAVTLKTDVGTRGHGSLQNIVFHCVIYCSNLSVVLLSGSLQVFWSSFYWTTVSVSRTTGPQQCQCVHWCSLDSHTHTHYSLVTCSHQVRVDSGIQEGSDISIYYDPMISKVGRVTVTVLI